MTQEQLAELKEWIPLPDGSHTAPSVAGELGKKWLALIAEAERGMKAWGVMDEAVTALEQAATARCSLCENDSAPDRNDNAHGAWYHFDPSGAAEECEAGEIMDALYGLRAALSLYEDTKGTQ